MTAMQEPPVRSAIDGKIVRARLATAAAFFLDGMIFGTWVCRIPAVQERVGINNAVLGGVLLVVSLGAMIAMQMTGRLTARFGSRAMVVAAAVLFGASLLLPGLAVGVLSLSGAMLVFGMGLGAMNVSINVQAVAVERRYGRPILASFHATFSFGGIAGAAIGSLAAAYGLSPAVHFSIVGVAAMVAAGFLWPWLLVDEVRGESDAAVRPRSWHFALLGAIAFCSSMGEGAMADWSAVFLRQASKSNASIAALGFGAYSISMTAGRLTADRVTQALGPRGMVRLGGSIAAGGIAIAVAFPQAWTAIAGFICVGAGLSALIPTIFSAAGRTAHVAPSVAIAAVATIGYVGFLCGPPMIGLASEVVTLRWALGLVCVACCVAVVLAGGVERGSGGGR